MNDPLKMDGPVLRPTLHPHPALQFNYPLPYGAIIHDDGVQFVVFSRSATAMRVLLYNHQDDLEPAEIITSIARRIVGETFGACSCRASGRGSSTIFRPTVRSIPSMANASTAGRG